MKLKPKCKYSDFLRTVHRCRGEVWYITPEHDRLNMKSTLCNLVFLSAIATRPAALQGELETEMPEDLALLSPFLQEAQEPETKE